MKASFPSWRSRVRSPSSALSLPVVPAVAVPPDDLTGLRAPPAPDLAHQPLGRVVVRVGDALLEGDDGVVGDLDVYWANFGAALGDVAEPETVFLLEVAQATLRVLRVHLKPLRPHEEAGTGELGMLVVGAQDVADVLAHEALDAPLRLVETLDILFVHDERRLLVGGERRDGARHLVVPLDVRDEVLHHRERPHGVHP